jgi:hypothetical protein
MQAIGMKTMALAMLALCLGGATGYAQQEVIGHWDVELDMAGNKLPGKLVVSMGETGLKGILTTPTGPIAIEEIKYEAGKITFSQKAMVFEQEMLVSFEGTLDGDTFSGMITSGLGPMPVTGRRSTAAPPVVGSWAVTSVLSVQNLTLTRILEVNEDLSGVYKSKDNAWPISDLAVDGDSVKFAVTIQLEGVDVPLTFDGTIDGASMTGAFFLDGNAVAQVTALRIVDASTLAGTWTVTLTGTPAGDFSHSAVLNADGTGTYEYGAESAPIKHVLMDGNLVKFSVAIQREGERHEIDFKGTFADGKIAGNIYEDGNTVGELLMSQGRDPAPES